MYGCVGEKLGYVQYYKNRITACEQLAPPAKGLKPTLEMQVADLIYCRGLIAKIFGLIAKLSKKSKNALKSSVFDWLCLRSLLQFMGFNWAQAEGFLLACDGHFFRGVWKMLTKK